MFDVKHGSSCASLENCVLLYVGVKKSNDDLLHKTNDTPLWISLSMCFLGTVTGLSSPSLVSATFRGYGHRFYFLFVIVRTIGYWKLNSIVLLGKPLENPIRGPLIASRLLGDLSSTKLVCGIPFTYGSHFNDVGGGICQLYFCLLTWSWII